MRRAKPSEVAAPSKSTHQSRPAQPDYARDKAHPSHQSGHTRPRPAPAQRDPGHQRREQETRRWSPDQFEVAPEAGKTRFQDLDLPAEVMHAIADLGFRFCTPIQAMLLPHALQGRNVAGRAQTGTGKTAAFLVTMFTRWLRDPGRASPPPCAPRALVLAPTRELVLQICDDAGKLGKYCPFHTVAVFGGMDYGRQQQELRSGRLDLVAATPGRLLDYASKKALRLDQVEVLVIDEADRMLDMGFIPDVRRIIRLLPSKERRQTMLFSATLDRSVLDLASQWMTDQVVIQAEPERVTVSTLDQKVWMVSSREKPVVLYNFLKQRGQGRILVFVNRRYEAERVGRELQRHGVPCEYLSGERDQKVRLKIVDGFKSGRIRVVVATDVAGRGLHVDDIETVINYDLPYEAEDYVHRVGRTGRAGAHGEAISFACEDESFVIPEIEKYLGQSLKHAYPPEEFLRSAPSARPEYPRQGPGRSR